MYNLNSIKMKTKFYLLVTAFMLFSISSFSQDYPTAEQVTEEAMAKAQAEKYANDQIVEEQRAAEKKQQAIDELIEQQKIDAENKRKAAEKSSQGSVIAE